MRNSFFSNDVTTLTTSETWRFHENDVIQIKIREDNTRTTAGTVEVLYRVKHSAPTYVDMTPYTPVDYSVFFPTRRELNNQAAQRGAQEQEEKHRRIPKKALVLRSSYQGMARLPCYRGTRPR